MTVFYKWMCVFMLMCGCVGGFAEAAAPLLVGTNAEYPPFTFREGGQIVGFDIDLAKEVGKRLQRDVTFKDMPFDALIPDLVMGYVDFVAAGMSPTEERAKRVLFTRSYLEEDPFVVLTPVKAGVSIHDLASLQGKTVAVNEGFTADLFMSSQAGVELVRLLATADAFIALTSGRVDAFVTAKSTLDVFLSTQDPAAWRWFPIEDISQGCSLAFPKKNAELLKAVQAVLDEMEKDGTLKAIKAKWKLS